MAGALGTRAPRKLIYSSASYAPGVMWKSGGFSGASENGPPPFTRMPRIADTAGVTAIISGFAYFISITSFLIWRSATRLASRPYIKRESVTLIDPSARSESCSLHGQTDPSSTPHLMASLSQDSSIRVRIRVRVGTSEPRMTLSIVSKIDLPSTTPIAFETNC